VCRAKINAEDIFSLSKSMLSGIRESLNSFILCFESCGAVYVQHRKNGSKVLFQGGV